MNIAPSVIGLLEPRSPAAVAALVIAIVVDAIERQSGWLAAHIRQKIRECFPSLAHGNPTAPVVAVSLGMRVRAAFNHCFPAEVFPCPTAPQRVAVFQVFGGRKVHAEASATFRETVPQYRAVDALLVSAVAAAHPHGTLDSTRRDACSFTPEHQQPTKPTPSEIN